MEHEKQEMSETRQKSKEETAIVLDFLPNGYPYDNRPMYKKTPIAQAIGKEHFVLLELVPKKGIHRLENPTDTPIELIEVQVGDYTGEDDIVRVEDVYGRK